MEDNRNLVVSYQIMKYYTMCSQADSRSSSVLAALLMHRVLRGIIVSHAPLLHKVAV